MMAAGAKGPVLLFFNTKDTKDTKENPNRF
jgi:hypothetical protein